MDWLHQLFSSSSFMPHGHCYLWQPAMVALQVGANGLIGVAYVAIAATLTYLVLRIDDLPFKLMYLAFGIFIIACGATHFFDIVTVWNPLYWVDGAIRALTAVASVGTALLLPPLVPKAIEFARAASLSHARGEELKLAHASLSVLYEKARREAEDAVRGETERLRLLSEAVPQLVFTSDAQGRLDHANSRWLEFTGQTLAEVQGAGWLDAVHPDDLEQTRRRWAEAVAKGQSWELEYRLRRRDGVYRWFLSRALPLEIAGTLHGWFGTCTDVEDQKQAIAGLRETVRLRDEFLLVTNHELRTPLAALQLDVQLILRTVREASHGEKLVRRAASAERQVERLTTLVETLLNVAQLDAGRLELSLAPADLQAIAASACMKLEDAAALAGVALQLAPAPPLQIVCDAPRLAQALMTILTNAIKYGRGHPVAVSVATSSSGGEALLTVRDHGIGIAAEDQARLFQRFSRAAPTRHYGGLGLSLWVARQIVEAHGGTIAVASSAGQGATFTITLPLAKAAP